MIALDNHPLPSPQPSLHDDSGTRFSQGEALSSLIEQSIRQYFAALGNETPSELYELMLHQLEKPLLTVVLEYTRGNQTRTAEILGLNRGTLRKKLKTHGLM